MPLVNLSRATALENLLARKTRTAYGLPESYSYRLAAAANLAGLVAELHAHRHYIIDLKPVNLSVYTDTFFMALLDCDGLSVHGSGGERFPAHQYSDGYICPEALQSQLPPQALGEEQDRFALAVILFQLLNQGLHPYQGVPAKGKAVPPTNGERIQQELYAYGRSRYADIGPSPWTIHEYFDSETRLLFDRAFTGHHDRPSAREWQQHLKLYADKRSGKVTICPANNEHVRFKKGCPWFALEAVQNQTKAGAQAPAKNSERPLNHSTDYTQQAGIGRTTPNAQGTTASTLNASQQKNTSGLPSSAFLYLIVVVLTLILFTYGVYYIGERDNRSRKLKDELFELSHPSIGMFESLANIGPDNWKDAILIEPRRPSSGRWELISMEVHGDYGKAIKGTISGFKFIADKPLEEENLYSVNATLRYRATNGEAVSVEKKWTIPSWHSVAPSLVNQKPKVSHLASKQTFTQADLNLTSGKLGIGSTVAFSMDGKLAFVGAASRRKFLPDPVGAILVFAQMENNFWEHVGTLMPNTVVDANSENSGVYQFGQHIQMSSDGSLLVTLACEERVICRDLHFFKRVSGMSWQAAGILRVNPDGEKDYFPRNFALAPDGRMLAVVVRGGILVYSQKPKGKWGLLQTLPKPQLGKSNHLGGDILFTGSGRTLLLSAPYSSRNKPQEGAVLVYSLGLDNRFGVQPNYLSTGVARLNFGKALVLSGNGKVLAVSAGSSASREIHLYDVADAQLSHSYLLKQPEWIKNKASDFNFTTGFSLSYDGKRLLSGPNVYEKGGLQMHGVKVFLYERRPEKRGYKYVQGYKLDSVNPGFPILSDYLNVVISPGGDEFAVGSSGINDLTRYFEDNQVTFKNGSLEFFSLAD